LVILFGFLGIATAKVSATWMATFAKGVLCNWLVCTAVWMATSTPDIGSKAAAVIFPIYGFVALGLEHSVANMFLIPFGMMQGASISVGDMFFKNLIPCTLGNFVGGSLFVAWFYKVAFGSK
jgi:formate/nitrite transporter